MINNKNKYKVNKEKCVGCGACAAVCPEGMELKEDGKAEVTDSEKLENCGGKNICPMSAIEEKSKFKIQKSK